jgi:tetratricopeptide (TPR) repeat protein
MKKAPVKFLLLVLLMSAQSASQVSPQSANETKRQATGDTVYSKNPEANELFLKARELYGRSDPRIAGGKLANAREAIKLYQQAVKIDPKFALAYVELSRAWLQLGYSDPDGLSNNEIFPPAKAALLKALALDKNLAEAHRVLAALYYNVEYNWESAEREYKFVLQLAPKSSAAHLGYANYLNSMGRFDEAIGEAKKAEELAPSLSTDITLARIYYSKRRYDEAAEYSKASLKKDENVLGHFFLGFIYVAQEKYEEAITEFKTGAGFSNNAGALLGLAYGYAMGSRRDEALKIIEELKATRKEYQIVPYRVAAVYLALGDKDQAIEWLRKDYEQKGNWMNQLKVDPVMDPLRSDPRFKKLMRRMKFKG